MQLAIIFLQCLESEIYIIIFQVLSVDIIVSDIYEMVLATSTELFIEEVLIRFYLLYFILMSLI